MNHIKIDLTFAFFAKKGASKMDGRQQHHHHQQQPDHQHLSRPLPSAVAARRRLGALTHHLSGGLRAAVSLRAAPVDALAVAPPPHGQPGPAVANNNVIVFFTDQQRFDTSSLHGNPMNLTPNFDRMAQRGTHIAEAVTCQPVCGPARSAFQTGLWPTTSGCFRNNIGLPDDCPKIAEIFRGAGCE